ncbi:glycosyltransferase [Candidatus Sumerlaeota bacterium]|nr:glycosyltransferase [Candidatus Sumerlaeota bacterium]
MTPWNATATALFLVSVFGATANFIFYPAAVFLSCALRRRKAPPRSGELPRVAMIVVVRNGEALIEDKIRNSLSLDYPPDKFELLVYSDGSTDRTETIAREFESDRLRIIASGEHHGKIRGLNEAAAACSADILVFSDADAALSRDALRRLVERFADPTVGGCCGQRAIRERDGRMTHAQGFYVRFDSFLKRLESRSGSVTSNDGKLYAVRRALLQPIADAVTDDSFVLLCVVKQGFRFVFENKALARIPAPARDADHELERRRRITSQSLRGIWLCREVLNPFRHGVFSANLFVNKIVRRLLPVSLVLLFVSTAMLIRVSQLFLFLLLAQAAFYALAICRWPLRNRSFLEHSGVLDRASSLAFYFCLGNLGMLGGLADFLRGRSVAKWNPLKADLE